MASVIHPPVEIGKKHVSIDAGRLQLAPYPRSYP